MFALLQAPTGGAPHNVADTVEVFDTVRTTIVDTVHSTVIDTIAVVAGSSNSPWTVIGRGLFALATLTVGGFAAYAAWKAAEAGRENARSAEAAATAATQQAAAAESQSRAAEQQLQAAQRSLEIQIQQLAQSREDAISTQRRNATSLASLAKRIRLKLADLNLTGPNHIQLRRFAHLNSTDITELEALARIVTADAVTYASKAAVSLRLLASQIDKAHSIQESMGWVPSTDEQRAYAEALDAGPKMLEALEKVCSGVAAL